jgi:hypothetical protein
MKMRRRVWPIVLGVTYPTLIAWLGGFRSDHLWMGALVLLDYYNEKSRKFLSYFLPFILTGVVYDSMRYFYWEGIAGRVHVADPYYRDLRWFGIPMWSDGSLQRVTPNEYFLTHHSSFFDLLCGFAYLTFVGQYLLTAFYLFSKKQWSLLHVFGWCFLCVNLMGFVTYFIYPAAPPWYVTQYGLGPALPQVQPSSAAAQRFDQLLGTHFFDGIYRRGVDVYGAYPSLHIAYPFLVAWVTFQSGFLRRFRLPSVGFYFLMCFSAVYLQHHYVVDLLLGTTYAIVTLGVARFFHVGPIRNVEDSR